MTSRKGGAALFARLIFDICQKSLFSGWLPEDASDGIPRQMIASFPFWGSRQNSAYSTLCKVFFPPILTTLSERCLMKLPQDTFIIELLPEFLDSWIHDVAYEFPKILQMKDGEAIFRFGHTLKGSCFQFGLEDVAELGVELMNFATAENWLACEEMQPRLLKSFVESKRQIEEMLSAE
jgi:hypothetical protein